MATEPKFAPGTHLSIVFKVVSFLPLSDPQTGDITFKANHVKAVAISETETEYMVNLPGFGMLNARIRKDEVLIIGELSRLA